MARTPDEFREIERMRIISSGMDITQDASKAIDEPWFVVRYMVKQAIKQFNVQTGGGMPRLIHIPPIVEAALQVDAARNLDKHTKLNEEKELFGFPVRWNAKEFKVE